MSNPHSAEEDKREWWIIRWVLRNDQLELRHQKPSWDELDIGDERIHVVPASEKKRLQTLLDECMEVIKYYADKNKWAEVGGYHEWYEIQSQDCGKKAREFLGKVKNGK